MSENKQLKRKGITILGLQCLFGLIMVAAIPLSVVMPSMTVLSVVLLAGGFIAEIVLALRGTLLYTESKLYSHRKGVPPQK